MPDIDPQEDVIIRRAARELSPGMVVNLGIGMPTLLPGVLPDDHGVFFQSENGFVGMGGPDRNGTRDSDVIDAGGRPCQLVAGAACFDSAMSFAIIRGGHLDVAFLGAFQVSLSGDLANWMIPGKLTPGMGGGMELAQKARRVIVLSRHLDKHGKGKLVAECTLPLTARACVETLITERAVFRCREGRMTLVSVHPDVDKQAAMEGMPEGLGEADALDPWEA